MAMLAHDDARLSRPTAMTDPDHLPACNRCRHYFITHDADFRYGCRAFDFKSQQKPMLVVVSAAGMPCRLFQGKRRKPGPQQD